MLTRRQILRADPATVPLEEYTRHFGHLHILKMPKEDENKKLRDLTTYRFVIFMKSSAIPAAVSALSVVFALVFFQEFHSFDGDYKLLSFFWPPASNEVAHAHQLIGRGVLKESFLQGLPAYMAACSATSLVWLIWLSWRLYRDVRDQGGYIPTFEEGGPPGLEIKIIQIILGCLLMAILLFTMAYLNLFEFHSLRPPTIYDAPFSYTMKKCIMLSGAYWALGVASVLSSIFVRNSRRLEELRRS